MTNCTLPKPSAQIQLNHLLSRAMAEAVVLSDQDIVPAAVRAALQRTEQDSRPVVLMTCGIAGESINTITYQNIQRSSPSAIG
jgi:hypothetical protein